MRCSFRNGLWAVAFGAGILACCFFPPGILVCLTAVIIIILGLILSR